MNTDDTVVRMDDDGIREFLSSRHVGVLGLPAEGAPSLRPMSFWFDGESRLYFLYVAGPDSRKAELTARADLARFLVYRAETPFVWESVLLAGPIDELSDDDREAVVAAMDLGRRPDAIERASRSETTTLYEMRIDEWSGIKQVSLPPAFRDD